LLLSILSTSYSIIQSPDQNFSFCFTNECLELTIVSFSASIKIFKGLLIVITSITTIGGIFLALKNYIDTHNSSILHNHISHLSLFKDFILVELEKRDKLELPSFDIFKWYNMIYKYSKTGSMIISSDYINFIKSINLVIESSNQKVSKATNGSYIYKNHQRALIDVMSTLGVTMHTLPRNNFYEVETQLMSLIAVVNNEFCNDESISDLTQRYYI
jgi:hypothetical protein